MTDRLQQDKVEENEQFRAPQTSILFEKYAVWVLLAGLVIAIWYRFVPLIIVSTFLLFLTVMIRFWRIKSLAHMELKLELSKSRIFANQDFHLDASLYNNKWLPLPWVEWEFPENKGIVLGDDETDTYLMRFLWLLWYQQVHWTIHGRAQKRGVRDIGRVRLRSGDGFRFSEVEQEYDLNGKLYVYPAVLPVSIPAFHPSMQWGMKGKQGGFLEDPLLVNGIREYQDGDEVRRFNWRASARTGKLHTNLYQPILVEQLFILVDVQGFHVDKSGYQEDDAIELQKIIMKKEADFEWMLSMITSIIVQYHRQENSIGLISNARNYLGNKMNPIKPSTNVTLILDQLAEMTSMIRKEKMSILDEVFVKLELSMPLFIFCEKVTNFHYMWYERNKQKLIDVRFFYMYETDDSRRLPIAQPLHSFLSNDQQGAL